MIEDFVGYLKKLDTSSLPEKLLPHIVCGDSGYIDISSQGVDALHSWQEETIKARMIQSGLSFVTPDEAYKGVKKMIGDSLVNIENGVGTHLDPTVYTHETTPIMLGPTEASLIYSNGGLPASIIDKKSKGMVINGCEWASSDPFWKDKVEDLRTASIDTGLNDALLDAVLDTYLYGGSIIYPVFKNDTPQSFQRKMGKMNLEKSCIERWVTVDRWNVTIVPSFIPTARDYLTPDTLYIPLSGILLSTSRCPLLRPRRMPYQAAMYNLGWSPSDIVGWLRDYYGYKITSLAVPVMAQQSSLILYRMPLDGLNATVGPDSVDKLMQVNEEKMREWSALSPKAVNMVGEVEVVNRTYSGMDILFQAMKSSLAAAAEIPEPVLWHTPNKGFSDNTTESLLKQSEAMEMRQRELERQLTHITEAIIAHVYGQNSEEWEKRDSLKIHFAKPQVTTEKELAESGARFAASVSSLAQAGLACDIAIELMQEFSSSLAIDDELRSKIEKSVKEQQEREDKLQKEQMKMKQIGGQGAGAFSKGSNAGAGGANKQTSRSSASKVSTK